MRFPSGGGTEAYSARGTKVSRKQATNPEASPGYWCTYTEGDVSGLKRSTNGADHRSWRASRRQVEICLTSHMFLSWGRGKGKVYAWALSDSIPFALPGDKRFECGQCQKRFMRSDHLTKHYKTHMVTKNL